jgi:hypothetical protein
MSTKSMSKIKELKWHRMLQVIRKVKEHPMSFDEIFQNLLKAQLVKEQTVGKRSVQNYLEELCAIEVLRFERNSAIYTYSDNEKQVYESKQDYQIALTHSKTLLYSNDKGNTQRLDQISPYLFLDILVYEPERDPDDYAVLQHLKTGYPEIYHSLEDYKSAMNSTGLSKRTCLPKIGSIDFVSNGEFSDYGDNFSELKAPESVNRISLRKNTESVITFTSGTLGAEDIIAKVPESKVRAILNNRDLAIGRIYGQLMNTVRNGTPLKGRCDYCPNIHIK